MTYDEKLAFLRRYRDAQRTMRRLLEELAQLRAEAASVSAALSGMPSGGGDGQAIPRAVERIVDALRPRGAVRRPAGRRRGRQRQPPERRPDHPAHRPPGHGPRGPHHHRDSQQGGVCTGYGTVHLHRPRLGRQRHRGRPLGPLPGLAGPQAAAQDPGPGLPRPRRQGRRHLDRRAAAGAGQRG